MKRITSVLFLVSVILLASFSGLNNSALKMKTSDCEALHLKGRIQSVSELLFNAGIKVDKIFKRSDVPRRADSTWFDESGNKTDEKIYGTGGKIETENTYTYDDNENLLEFVYLVNNRQRQKDVYTYDSLGKVATWARYGGADSLYEKDTYFYDSAGHQNEQDVEEHYTVKQTLKRYYTYNERGNRLEEYVFKLGRSVSPVHAWKYDEAGNIAEEDDYSSHGIVDVRIMFKYERGHLTERSEHLPDGSVSGKEVYTYNAKGYKTEYDIYNRFGKLFHYYTYTYDVHGNITHEKEFKVFSDDGPQLENYDTYELIYDKKGNWIKQTDLKLDGTVTLTQRDIHYY